MSKPGAFEMQTVTNLTTALEWYTKCGDTLESIYFMHSAESGLDANEVKTIASIIQEKPRTYVEGGPNLGLPLVLATLQWSSKCEDYLNHLYAYDRGSPSVQQKLNHLFRRKEED